MSEIEVSVVMPCLNEASTVGICVGKALKTMDELGIKGEVVVSDNGSIDDSVSIAEKAGARVVHQSAKGYGNAYLKGFAEAKGKYIVMGDADDSYDFTDLKRFIEPLRQGFDMVMGTRIKGEIIPGAMPFLHKYLGVPVLTWMLNLLFKSGISDAHCGMRSFTKEAYEKMRLQTAGMEFASEMVIKAKHAGLRIDEIPITLHPDGRPGKPHLKSFQDGWRHVRFMLNYKPTVLYLIPGIILFVGGLLGLLAMIGYALISTAETIRLLYWSSAFAMVSLAGYFIWIMGIIAQAKNYTGHFPKVEKFISKFFRKFNSSRGIWRGIITLIAGLIMATSIQTVNYNEVGGFVILGLLLMGIGGVNILASFLLGQMNIFGKE